MSPAADLLADLTGRGIELQADGDRLRFRPLAAMTPELTERLKAHRPELLAILGDKAAPPADAPPEPHADGEWRRFEATAIPWRHGWRDPSATGALLQHLAAAGRAMDPDPKPSTDARIWPAPTAYPVPGGGTETFTERAERWRAGGEL